MRESTKKQGRRWAGNLGRNLFSHFKQSAGWLAVVFLFLIFMCGNANAQENSGTVPYINSWHTYRVVVGNTGNTREWDMYNGTDTIHLADAMAWVDILPLSGSNADIRVCFTDTVFAAAQTWELLYREISSASGTCVAARKFTITPVENEFYFTLAANDTICKTEDGDVLSWDNIDTETYTTSFTYRVTLHKEATFILTGWSFDAQITLNPANHNFQSYTAEVVPVSEGTNVITDTPTANDGIFHVALSQLLVTPGLQTVAVDITVTLSGRVFDAVEANLQILNGEATSGVSSVIITYDNIDMPVMPGDREQLFVLNALPATKNIAAAPTESAWSAANPVQYSTHSYTVEMGDMVDNHGNAGTGWYLETQAGVAVPLADYSMVHTESATDDSVTFIFNMVPGNYNIRFAEVGDNGCSTIRQFPIILGDPFDVDIRDMANLCPDVSGTIIRFDSVSLTTVDYVVDLVSSGYAADWDFDFEISTNPGAGVDFFVNSGGISVVDANGHAVYTEGADAYHGSVHVTYNSVTPTTSFIIRVVFRSQYVFQHEITASMTNITGEYGERDLNTELGDLNADLGEVNDDVVGLGANPDTDGDDQNNTVHLINTLPQPLMITGIE